MVTVTWTWNGPDRLVDISKYLLSVAVLLPVSSRSYGFNLAPSLFHGRSLSEILADTVLGIKSFAYFDRMRQVSHIDCQIRLFHS